MPCSGWVCGSDSRRSKSYTLMAAAAATGDPCTHAPRRVDHPQLDKAVYALCPTAMRGVVGVEGCGEQRRACVCVALVGRLGIFLSSEANPAGFPRLRP